MHYSGSWSHANKMLNQTKALGTRLQYSKEMLFHYGTIDAHTHRFQFRREISFRSIVWRRQDVSGSVNRAYRSDRVKAIEAAGVDAMTSATCVGHVRCFQRPLPTSDSHTSWWHRVIVFLVSHRLRSNIDPCHGHCCCMLLLLRRRPIEALGAR